MKYLIIFFTIVSFGSIIFGYFFESDYEQQFIGFGDLGIFFIVFPLFSYYRWKDKDVKDYVLNKENLDKMRERNE